MKYIALHHTADPSLEVQLYKVNRYHKDKWGMKSELGWYVGYNYFCERNGTWTNARRIGEETVANKGHNCDVPERCDTISFCMAGDFRIQKPSDLQTATFTSFVNKWKREYPDIVVVGHRDIGNTTCPGVPQSYIDQFNESHSDDQAEKAEQLAQLQSRLDYIRAALARIKAFISNNT